MGKKAHSRRSMWAGFLMVGIGLVILMVVIAMGG
jgi:hypothetical protein